MALRPHGERRPVGRRRPGDRRRRAHLRANRAGEEFEWGEVTLWEPPRRFGYLWHLRRDRADATDVVITFVDRGNSTTRVEIEHGGWERLGVQGPDWREANKGGWSTLLPHFIEISALRDAELDERRR